MLTHVHNITLHYEDQGQGVAILLIHAFPLSSAMWQPQIAALTPQFRVIAPDLRGFGASDVPPGPYAMDLFAADLAGLLDTLGIEQVILGGLSMGGYIAFAFMRHYPDRVRALILANTRASADTSDARAGRETNAQLVEQQGAGAIADKMLPTLLGANATPELRAHVRSIIERNQPQGIAAALRGMALRPDSTDLLSQINVPTLFIGGSEDTLTTPAVLREMHSAVVGSQMVELPGAGHLSNLEQPDAFNTALLTFLHAL